MLNTIAKLLKVLNGEGNPSQISLGFAAGMIVGLTPLWSLHNAVFAFLVFLFRVNLSAFLLSFAAFSGIAYLVDPIMDQVGSALLTSASMQELWTSLYNQTAWRLTHFNNTLTLGSLVSACVLALPLFFASNFLITNYRLHILEWVRKTKVAQFIKAGRLYRAYNAIVEGD